MKFINILKFLLVLSLFANSGCDKVTNDQTFTIGSESTFRISQLYYSSDGQFTLLINEVNDSRCAEGVVCVWAGEVALKGEWTNNIIKTPVELHSVLKDMQKEPDGFTIQIVDVKPYPKIGTESKPEDKVITLLVKRK